jgi:hypothetical protein
MKVIIGICFIVLSSCASYGEKIDRSYANEIKEGVTTEANILQNLGKPTSIGLSSSGDRTMTYMHFSTEVKAATFIPIVGIFAGGSDSQTTVFIITIDGKTGLVKDWNYNESNSEVNNGVSSK